MADTVTAKHEGKSFTPHPGGQFTAVCVDVIDMGEKMEAYPGSPDKLVQKVYLVFRTGELNPELGEPIDIAREFSVSMGEKSNLRKFLQQWRGKSYTEDEARQGVPLHKLDKRPALISVEQKTSAASGRIYANIISAAPLPKPMEAYLPQTAGYSRPDYFGERKQEYAEGAKRFRATINAPTSHYTDAVAGDTDDDLPF